MCAGAVGSHNQLLHGVFRSHQPAGGQLRVLLRDIGVDFPGEVHIDLLCRVVNVRLGRQLLNGQRRKGGLAGAGMRVHEGSVLCGSLQYGFRCLGGVFRHGGESVHAVPVYPGGNAGYVGTHVAHYVAVQQHNPAGPAVLSAQFRMCAVSKQCFSGSQNIL